MKIFNHVLCITGITAFLVLLMLYPFFPGEYDHLAFPVSMLVQITGILGLLLSVTGFLWILNPAKSRIFRYVSLYAGTLIVAVVVLLAILLSGKILAGMIVLGWFVAFVYLKRRIRRLYENHPVRTGFLPFYMMLIPAVLLSVQMSVIRPLSHWSRNKAMDNAAAFIAAIEAYKVRNGSYPISLQAMYKDYSPGVTGIEKYHYLLHDGSYNISFELPVFLLDRTGSREWVVYNPANKHRVYSHTSWFLILSKEELESSQGWYESGETSRSHWKYFLFD